MPFVPRARKIVNRTISKCGNGNTRKHEPHGWFERAFNTIFGQLFQAHREMVPKSINVRSKGSTWLGLIAELQSHVLILGDAGKWPFHMQRLHQMIVCLYDQKIEQNGFIMQALTRLNLR